MIKQLIIAASALALTAGITSAEWRKIVFNETVAK